VPLHADGDLLFTADFFTPIVDDPYDFGAIAASNAMSDIYAKGGTPIAALNLAAFPDNLETAILGEILRGGVEKAAEGGVMVVGGHTVKDREIKFGMAVIGRVAKGEFLSISGAHLNDALVLTKPIGTGVLSTALKRGLLDRDGIAHATSSMLRLNAVAGQIARNFRASAATDVTGYGLLGHLLNMAQAGRVEATVLNSRVALFASAREMAGKGCIPAGGKANLQYVEERTSFDKNLDEMDKIMLTDPQTSGGLLIAVAAERSTEMVEALVSTGHTAAIIGQISADEIDGGHIVARQ
jgi:selenium donor protein